jgi:putative transcriptional regulator
MNKLDQMGKNIKSAREKSTYTQGDIAKMVGINVNYYARIERGEHIPSIKVLKAIAKILKIKTADIVPF